MVQSFHNLRVRENHYFKNIVRPISIYFQNLKALNKSKGTQSELEWDATINIKFLTQYISKLISFF